MERTNGELLTSDTATKAQIKAYEKSLEEMNVAFEQTTDAIGEELRNCNIRTERALADLHTCQAERDELQRRRAAEPHAAIVAALKTSAAAARTRVRDTEERERENDIVGAYARDQEEKYQRELKARAKLQQEYEELRGAYDELDVAYSRLYVENEDRKRLTRHIEQQTG